MKTLKLDAIIVDHTFNPRQNGPDWISVEEYSQAVDDLPPMHWTGPDESGSFGKKYIHPHQ